MIPYKLFILHDSSSNLFCLPRSSFILTKPLHPSKVLPLRDRTKQYALRIIRLYSALPQTTVAQTIGKQILRSGTSIGAHYREASRARSDAEFRSKMQVAIQELDETDYWLELLVESAIFSSSKIDALKAETNELIAIFIACVKKQKDEK